jgi:putative tricarboxylic transport membrane protein
MWADILIGFVNNLSITHVAVVLIGTVAGLIIGALPGLSATSAVALLLPFTFTMDPVTGLIMLAAVYMSAEYGGSISAILINTPGTAGAACTVLEGTPLTRRGHAQEALYVSLLGGVVGGMFGALVLLFLTRPLADMALLLGPAETFWVAVTGLALVASLSGPNVIKGILGVTIGIALTLVGQDIVTGNVRFIYGNRHMLGGIPLIPALLGLFAVASVLALLERPTEAVAPLILKKGILRQAVMRLSRMKGLLTWSSVMGAAIGLVPGAGAAIAAFVAYGTARSVSRHPEEFGHGSFEGIAAPETANNAVVGGALVPLLVLGIPGSGSAAIMFGALAVHGIIPGPRLFTERAELAYTFMVGLTFTVVAMLIVGLLTIRWSSLIVRAPRTMMLPGVLVLATMGAYGLANSLFDVYVLMTVGVIAYFLAKVRVPLVTMALGLVLGRLIEQTYQQSSIVAGARKEAMFMFFLSRPLNILLMLICALVVFSGIRQIVRERRTEGVAGAEAGAGTMGRGISMRFANVFLGLFTLLLAAAGFWEVQRLSERGGQFPILVASIFLVFGTLLLIQSVRPGRRMDQSFPFDEVPWRNLLIVVLALVAMTLGLTRIGFYESAFLFSGFTCWLMLGAAEGARRAPLKRLATAMAFATGLMIVVYVAFGVVIQLPTPRGLLL